MSEPDFDVCQPVYDEAGHLVGIVYGSPEISDEARRALAAVIEAATGRPAKDDVDGVGS